ncbi:metastasis-associated in colon cancer protein 1 isoform X3 [Mesocricetus auratus]|uniref:Metastasis-associated in colon cancer protein 1 isoform X3 n=1 Tax=Mesocricetus auratus TaxID=10036 RepID=A0ABM2XBB7_MESAU|nr:metastasis-associated in colon cancer protein 1 isoform X3 [Mesocricetus auratus]
MLISERACCWPRGIVPSRSEGNLVDMEALKLSKKHNITACQGLGSPHNCLEASTHRGDSAAKATNPFWNELSASNPFLDDITQLRNNQKRDNLSILKEDPFLFLRQIETGNSFDSSGDELDIDHVLRPSSSRKSGRSKSVSELLDMLHDTTHTHRNTHISDQILIQDLEWLQNDREAYKMAWLSHRQLARSCLDLNMINQSPGWAQTQIAETTAVCKLNHEGGSVQLPDSDITVHVPQGHIAVGEFQEVSLRAFMDLPPKLNHDHSCTVSPLLEIRLSNLKTMGAILLEMKIGAEVKTDPLSQVMTKLVCLHSLGREGPFQVLNNCYFYKDTIQAKFLDLSQVMYIVIAVQAEAIQPPATSVWDYIHKTTSIGIYGPKYIHPSFTAVLTVCGHNYMPGKFTVSDIKKGGKNTSPVVFHLWGKHSFLLDKPQDLIISAFSCDPDFEVKVEKERKIITQRQLEAGAVVHQQVFFSSADHREMHLFVFRVHVEPPNGKPITQFFVTSPDPAPNLKRLSHLQNYFQKEREGKKVPLLSTGLVNYPTFQDKKVNFTNYGVTLKTVLRQSKIEYLLEYLRGDIIALLGEGTVRAIGQSKVKEWYVGVLRGKIGLVHCKNVKVISKEQVMSMSDDILTTKNLLEQIALPFKNLTYIYSVVLTLVSENIHDWKILANVLGYSHLAQEDFDQIEADKEPERVSYIVKKLKEDCHEDKSTRKFLYEVIVTMWKPAYDFLYAWSTHYGNSYRDVLQDLQSALDRMKNPVTKRWRDLTGTLILVNSLEVLRWSPPMKLTSCYRSHPSSIVLRVSLLISVPRITQVGSDCWDVPSLLKWCLNFYHFLVKATCSYLSPVHQGLYSLV